MKKLCFSILILLFSGIAVFCQTQGELTVSLVTSEAGGNYAPKNILAIWIEDDGGNFVKTLLVNADSRKNYLNKWEASTASSGTEYNDIDAISGATNNTHSTKSCSWNGTNYTGTSVPDGTYNVRMELTDKNSSGNYSSFLFTKGPHLDIQTPSDKPSFSSISIKWIPTTVLDYENISPILTYCNNSPQTSIAITWVTDSYAECVVHYGIENVNENSIVVSEHKDLVSETDSLIHIARLTDLTQNTLYHYTVETADVFQSDTFSFKTANDETNFKFIVGGDNQLGLVKPVLYNIIAEKPDFMIHVGDLVVDGNVTKEWFEFLSRFKEFTGNYVMMPVYGNHEEDSPTMAKLFQHPVNNSIDAINEGHWFSFDYNNVHFAGVDVFGDFSPGSEQYEWLENDLKNIGENIDHRIVYFHKPAYNSTGYHGPDLQVRQYLEPLLIEYGVDLVFSGHNHHYERSLANGITYITTGGMSEYLKDFDLGSNPWSICAEKVNHYCRVSVNGADLKVEMVRQDGTIGDIFQALKVDGNDKDWLSSKIEPLIDTDKLQTDSTLKLERLFLSQDEDNFYFGFDAPAINKGVTYGLYIDVDNVVGSGGTSDRWGKALAAKNDHLPEIQIYAFHADDDSWSSSSPRYYSWDTISSDWVGATGGMGSLPEGGVFAVDTTNRFFEMAIPKDAPGFNGTDNFYVELFTVGEVSGAGASESIPSDSTIQFTIENTSTDTTYLTAFYGFNVPIPLPPDLNIIKTDGCPHDWKDNNIEPLATDTDNAQDGTDYKMDSLYVHMDSVNCYLGFITSVEFTGLHYGIYIDTDGLEGSGATEDRWVCDVKAVDLHLPEVGIYAYHNADGSWSASSPKYYTWSGSSWQDQSGGEGTLPTGGRFAYDPEFHFMEILIPRNSPGFEDVSSFYISLFNFGGAKNVSETIPSDPAVDFNGENTSTSIEISNFAFYHDGPVNADIDFEIPSSESLLKQNYPNPCDYRTRIDYSLNRQANASIKVYDTMGKLVATLVDEPGSAGDHHVILDSNNMSSGVYFYQLTSGKYRATKKLLIVK